MLFFFPSFLFCSPRLSASSFIYNERGTRKG
ncbi:hypothetical protein Pint_01006 [Pistacia integerrima]|uniref:Uncharacterized protein n=1 Tax=Pistacia integerrima TaxID=434235 RepID=A0ACC0ZIX3_9ROSI|nr:hypothetical protein Pint_01006 [Pistacia integerrima]